MARPKLSPDINVDYELTLRFASGMLVEGRYGNQKMFTVADHEGSEFVLYLPVEVGERIEALQLHAGDRFRLMKREVKERGRRTVEWVIGRVDPAGTVSTRQTAGAPPSAAASQHQVALPREQQAKATTVIPIDIARRSQDAMVMASCLASAIDALQIAREYGKQNGWDLPFTEEDVRTVAASLFIQRSREAEGAARAAAGGGSWQR